MARRNGEAKYGTLGYHEARYSLLEILTIILIFASLIGTPQMLKGSLISSTAVCQAGRLHAISGYSDSVHFYRGDVRAFCVAVTRTVLMMNASHHDYRQCRIQLHFCIRALRCTGNRYCRSCTWIRFGRSDSRIYTFFLYTFFYMNRGKYKLFRFHSGFGLIREILNVSVWAMILYFLTMGTWFLFSCGNQTLGRTSGHFQHYPQHLYPAVHASQCF